MQWGPGVDAGQARARQRQDDLLHLPPVVDDELRRLPSADPGQLEDRAPPLRRRRDAQLRDLQPAGRARRHVPARPPRPGEGRQDRAGALVARRWCCRRPTSTASASTSSSRRSSASGFSSQAFAPHYPHTERKTETKTCTDCHVSAGERQQRDHGAAAAAGNQLRQLRRLQRLGRRGAAASRRCRSPSGTSRRR